MALPSDEYEGFWKSVFDFIWRELDPLEEQIEKTGRVPMEGLFPNSVRNGVVKRPT